MDIIKAMVIEALAPVAAALLRAIGFVVWGALIVSWCLLVLFLSGRFPWFVRKYL